MARSMWRGAISFGMVAIPVRMYLATDSKSVSFRLLCPSCHRPIKNRRFCEHENKEVAWNDTVRGFEVSKDEFVEIDDSDLDRLPLPSSRAIEILEFVEDSSIDAGLYMKQAYYLEPEKVGMKPYALLREALARTGRVAIGRLALRDREHLVRLALHDEGVILNTLHWPDEIRDMRELTLPGADVTVSKGELDMAVMLVDSLAAEFDPARHHDHYREALLQVVEEKMGKREVRHEEPAAEPAKVMDLMAALKASLEANRRGGAEAAEEADGAAAPQRRSAQAARRTRSTATAEPKAEPARRRKAS